ncbi:Thioredoxin domain-containing protein [Aphelenchoides bicaudatus]|nr:Thioredoxin domain-containing protein [Aphelenchoides bicaudatus]
MRSILFLFVFCWTSVYPFNDTTSNTCPAIPFSTIIHSQCPTFSDLRCVRFMAKTKDMNTINCALTDPSKNPEMKIVNATELISALQETDVFDRCSVVMFFAPNCVFSRQAAEYVYLLAKLFPQLRVYAVNIHKRSSVLDHMINQHGIAATPIIFLFENKVAKLRLVESSSLRSLAEIILRRTDLKLPKGIKLEELSTYGVANEDLRHEYNHFINEFFDFEEYTNGIDRYFIAALIILLINIIYFLHFSSKLQQWLNR